MATLLTGMFPVSLKAMGTRTQLATGFPAIAAFVPDYSGGTAPDFHGIPCSTRYGYPDQL